MVPVKEIPPRSRSRVLTLAGARSRASSPATARTGPLACSGARRRPAPKSLPLRCSTPTRRSAPSPTGSSTGCPLASPARRPCRPAPRKASTTSAGAATGAHARRASLPLRGPRTGHLAGPGSRSEAVGSGLPHQRSRAGQGRTGRHLPARLSGPCRRQRARFGQQERGPSLSSDADHRVQSTSRWQARVTAIGSMDAPFIGGTAAAHRTPNYHSVCRTGQQGGSLGRGELAVDAPQVGPGPLADDTTVADPTPWRSSPVRYCT